LNITAHVLACVGSVIDVWVSKLAAGGGSIVSGSNEVLISAVSSCLLILNRACAGRHGSQVLLAC